ncbi:hypothetical protein [Pseudomonas fluorescens]|uniref:hypothetical protein n=1 Tax=Pseudomonas fluorescens TaxID=294 RepID=UPI0012412C43|nr:hypothetical protein [Pseudomonas fluorescens]VVO62435.1 hypothetical protein PS898_00870 [Pseudomonas fluorescens]
MSANEFLENSSHPQPAGGQTNTASNAEGVRALQTRKSGIPSSNTSLFPRFDDDNSSLAMRPLLIAGMVRPLADGDGGINLDVVEDNDAGILCVINPYIGMQLGDQYDVHWGAQIVYSGKVQPDEVNKQLLFYLPKTIAQPGWVEECYYQLTRFGESTPDDPSVALRLLVKLTRPGGRDKAPHLPDGHSELHPAQLPKDVVQQGIDAEWAKKGVPVTIPFYPEMALGDTILVHWGSANNILAPHTVTQDEVDGKNPIVIIADQAAILAGGDSDALVVRYNIHDVVWNWAVRHSQSNRVRVDAGGWRLEAPVIKESINGIITIKNLKKEDVTVQVHVQPEDFTLGDTVTLSFIGTPAAGKPLIHSTSKIVVSIPSILELKVPYAHIRAIAMGLADASYVLKRQNGEPLLSSRRTFARVVGDVLMLPEPTIRELSGNILAPDEASATVGISYLGIRSGDVINLRWTGTRSNGTPYAHPVEHIVSDNDAKAGIVTLHVDNEHISVLNNGTLDVSYRVSNDQVALYGVSESEPLLAKVEKIRATLPVPVVEEADPSDMLDPSKDPVHLLIEAQTTKDDILTYYWRADNPQGSTSDRVTITTVIEGQPLRFRVDKRFVTPNVGTTVKVSYVLWRADTGRYEYSETLDLLIAGRVSPTIDSVVNAKGVEIPDNGVTFDKSVTVSGKASPSQKIRLRDGTSTLHEPSSNGSGDWSQVVSSLSVKAYNLTALALYGDGPVSPLRTFTVAQTVTPTIANVTDTKGTVANGGTTYDRSATVSGTASPNQTIRLRDGNSTLHEPSANGSGNWNQVVSSLSVKAYSLTALALYGDGPVSTPPRRFTVESWTDSVTDFTNGTSGNWLKGPAGFQGRVTGGVFHNDTTAASGHSGLLFSQTFLLLAGHTYSFSYRVRNFSPLSNNVPPIFSVTLASGPQILPVYNVPRNGQWYTQTKDFSVTQSANHTIQIVSHQDRGGGGGSDGGNDYQIDDIIVRLIR